MKNIIFCLAILFSFNFSASAQMELFEPNLLNEDEAQFRLNQLNEHFQKTKSNKIYFNSIYLLVTKGLIQERLRPEYRYSDCLQGMITEFANMYLMALKKDNIRQAPLPWGELFKYDGKPTSHLLLGMNAHINYDLPLSLVRISKETRFAHCTYLNIEHDYFLLNDFFKRMTPLLNRELKRVSSSKSISDVEDIMENAIYQMVVKLRKDAWITYLDLLDATDVHDFREKRNQLERRTGKIAKNLKTLNFILPVDGY